LRVLREDPLESRWQNCSETVPTESTKRKKFNPDLIVPRLVARHDGIDASPCLKRLMRLSPILSLPRLLTASSQKRSNLLLACKLFFDKTDAATQTHRHIQNGAG